MSRGGHRLCCTLLQKLNQAAGWITNATQIYSFEKQSCLLLDFLIFIFTFEIKMGKLLISHNCRQLNLGDKSDKIKGDNLDPDKQERDVFLPLCCMLVKAR